jgi:FkbM family methyltransferase
MKFLNLVFTRARNVLPNEKLAAARKLVLQNCDLVVDVGANTGQWMSMVRKHGYLGEAICIEPLEKYCLKLKERKFKNTIALNCAVGNKNGHIIMNIASNDGLSSSVLELDHYHNIGAPDVKYIGKEEVKILKLSKILETSPHKKMFVKIDTQGYEIQVLKSINKSHFNKIYAFEIESNLVSTYKSAILIEDLIKYLRRKGFQPFRIENGFGMPNFGQQLQVDIIFVKDKNLRIH